MTKSERIKTYKSRIQCEPVRWVEKVLKEGLWDKQKEILESIRDNTRTAVKTCHGTGKTRVASDAALWFLYAHPKSVVITTAPTWRQVEQLLWREIRERYDIVKDRVEDFPGRMFQTPKLELAAKWYALGVSTKEPERLSGFHAEWMLIIVDESSGVDDAIFEAIRGIMSAGNARLLLLGNPTKPSGEFYDAFNGKRKMYNTISVSAWDTPNLTPLRAEYEQIGNRVDRLEFLRKAPVVRSYLVSPSWVADMLDEFGEDSPIFRVRVMGEFPSSLPDQLIKLHWVEAAVNRWYDLADNEKWWKIKEPCVMGADIARYGDSETVLCTRKGSIVAPLVTWGGKSLMETAGAIKHHATEMNAVEINIDAVGVGGGVFDRLREQRMGGIRDINFGDKPWYDRENYCNLRAEAWGMVAKRFEEGDIAIPPDDKLIGQLTSPKFTYTSDGKLKIESKEDMRKRGVSSPDRADALCQAFLKAARSSGFDESYVGLGSTIISSSDYD